MSRCTRCSAAFGCAIADGIPGPCWCATYPPLVAIPSDGVSSCWCPACLKQHLDTQKSSSETPQPD